MPSRARRRPSPQPTRAVAPTGRRPPAPLLRSRQAPSTGGPGFAAGARTRPRGAQRRTTRSTPHPGRCPRSRLSSPRMTAVRPNEPSEGDPRPEASIELDLRRILWIQGIRAAGYGFGSILFGSALAASGLSDAQVGLVFTAMLAGMALCSIGVGLWADRVGRRRVYAGLLIVMGAAGAVFAFTAWLPALIVAALTGTLSTDPNESGPISTLEQAMIGQAPASVRVRVFGRYNAIAYLMGALGSLAAGGPELFRRVFPSLPADRRFLLAFPL